MLRRFDYSIKVLCKLLIILSGYKDDLKNDFN